MSKQQKQRCQYSPSKMLAAIDMVKNQGMAKKKAAKLFGVPKTTLLDKLSGRVPEKTTRPGPAPILTIAEERTLVRYIELMSLIGYPLTKKELLYEVKRILDIDGRKTIFKENLPGRGWYEAFKIRNPDMRERTPAKLGSHRTAINMEMIEGWYTELNKFLDDEIVDYQQMIRDPRRVFNADESGFPISVNSGKVLTTKGSKHVYQVTTGDKTQITVMACLNACGGYMPPLIVYPGQRFRDTVLSGFPEAIYGHSAKGWMDSELFVAFLHHFDENISENSIPRPVLLFVDGHSTHMSLPAATFCSENGIVLYCLLANATHILQACDIGLFSPLKNKWKESVKAWQMEHLGEALAKTDFPGVFKSAWSSVTTIGNSVSAFKRSGLFPLSSAGIDKTKLGPSKLTSGTGASSSGSDHDMTPVAKTPSPLMAAVFQPPAQGVSTCAQYMSPAGDSFTPNTVMTKTPKTRRDPDYVSPAFNKLRVPELKQKKKTTTIRKKMPKASSGSKGLEVLRQRETDKREEEERKQARKLERERKKREREEEKERKKVERETNKKIKMAQLKKK